MNSKAIRKQLLAAVAMVLVAAVALGSSTYAWFVASGTVTATGMSVKAQSEGGIVIRYGGGKWGTTATAGMQSAENLLPISTYNLANWYHASAQYKDAATAAAGTRQNFTSQIMNDGTFIPEQAYVVMKEFEVASGSSANIAKGLYVSGITVTEKNQTMSTALRVGVKSVYNTGTAEAPKYESQYHIYAPVNLGGTDSKNFPSTNYSVYTETGAVAGTFNGFPDYTSAASSIVPTTFEIGTTNGVKVQIFIWFEGEDHNLYTDNYHAENLEVSVNLSAVTGGYDTTPDNLVPPVDLSSGTTISKTATTAKATADAESTSNYYEITGKTSIDGKKLYTDETSKDGLTADSVIYIINGEGGNAVAEVYTNVTKPAASGS